MYGKPLPVGKPAPAPVKGKPMPPKGKPMPPKGKPVPKGTMGDGVGGYNRPKGGLNPAMAGSLVKAIGMAKGGATKKGMAKGGMTKKGCK